MLKFSQAVVKEWPSFKKLKLKGNTMTTLTQSQAQYLVTRLSFVAQQEQEYRSELRRFEGFLWNKADKDAIGGANAFSELNSVRDSIRASKTEEAKINTLIRQLRKAR